MVQWFRHILVIAAISIVTFVAGAKLAVASGESRPVSGVLAAANGTVEARSMHDAAAPVRRLRIGGQIFFEDEVMTGPGVRAQILLRDGTTFSLGEGASLVLDEFVYDPASGEGGVGAVIKRGAFRFVSGRIAKLKPQNMRVVAGNSSIAVRGTEVLGTIGGGQDSVILLSGQIDVSSLSAACTGGAASGGNDLFSFGDNGDLQLSGDTSAGAPAGCRQSLVRSGFGVQLGQSGQVSTPSRVDVSVIDEVIDAVSVKEAEVVDEGPVASIDDAETSEAAEPDSADATGSEDSVADEPASEATATEEVSAENEAPSSTVVEAAAPTTNEETDTKPLEETPAATTELAAQVDIKPEDNLALTEVASVEPAIVTGPATLRIGEDDKPLASANLPGEVTEPEAAGGLSEFDKVVMRAFGMLEEADKTDVAPSPVVEINMVEAQVKEDQQTEESKTDQPQAQTSEPSETKENEPGLVVEEIDERAVAEAEQRRDIKIEEATRDLKDGESTDNGETNSNSTPDPTLSTPNTAPTLAAITGVAFSDTAGDDSFTNASGALTGSDADSGDTLTYSISGGGTDTSQSGYNQSRAGTYGTLYLNTTSGAYLYIPSDSAVEGTTSSQSEAFTLAVSDGTASASQTLTTTISGVNDTPILGSLAGISVTDTAADDTFSDVSNSLNTTERDSGDSLAYAISGGASDTSQSGYTHSRAGTYGTLYLNKSSGAYKYVPNDSAIEGLKNAQSESFSLSVSDGTATATQTLTTTVNGADDAPTLAALSAITITDTANDDSFTAVTATATGTERDTADTLSYAITGGSADTSESGYTQSRTGSFGTLYLNASTGAYKYIPNETNVERLKTQQTESFTLTASDGTTSASQTLTTTIDGANDTPVLSALTAMSYTDTTSDDSFAVSNGTMSATERDSGETLTYSITGASADTSLSGFTHSMSGTYGTLYINSGTGAYRYVPQDSSFEGATSAVTDAFTMSVSDGGASASQTLTVNVGGVNDTPGLAAITGLSFTDTASDDSFTAAAASLSATDRDSGDTLTYAITGGSADTSLSGYTHSASGTYGTLYVNSSSGAYSYVPNDSAMEGLTGTQTDSFTMSVSDGTASASQSLVATVNGANDTPGLAAITGIAFTDTSSDDTFSAATASLSASDRDSGDSLTYSISGGSADTSLSGYTHSASGTYGTLYVNSSSGAYSYVPNDSAIEGLTSTQTDSFTMSVSDGTASANQTLTATVTGANDDPVLGSLSGISVTDTSADDSFSATTASLSSSDRDSGDTLSYAITGGSADSSESGFSQSRTGTYGTLYLNTGTGAYKYVPRDSNVERIKTQQTETFTLTASDGTASASQTLTTTIDGVNDIPVLSAVSALSFTDTSSDDSFSASTATLSAADRDSGETLTYAITGGSADTSLSGYTHSASGSYGTLYVNSTSGAYSYVPNDNAMEALKSTQTDSFTMSVSDGTASASQSLVATVSGVNDAPSLAGLSGLSITDTANDDSFTATSSSLSASDRDSGDTLNYELAGGNADTSQAGYTHSVRGTYGAMFVNSSTGDYRYVPLDTFIERLTDTQSESFTFRVTDGTAGTSRSLTTTITGVNDTPVLSSISAISVVDTTADDTFTESTGSMSASDRDSGQTITYGTTETTSASPDTDFTYVIQGDYGMLLFNQTNGNYEYRPTDTLVEALASDATDTFNMTASDGTASAAQTLTVNLTGADDGPTAIDTSLVTGNQQTGSTGLRVGVTRDPEGDTITDLSSSLPVWLSFGNQTLGDGSVEYYWETGTNERPWRNGSRTLNLSARSSGQTVSTSVNVQFVCSGTNCSDFIASTDTVTSPTIQNPTSISQITGGMKINGTIYNLLDSSAMNTLFNSGSGTFRQIYTAAEANAGGNGGNFTIDQTVNADYANRKINLTSNIGANNIYYFGGTSDSFTYTKEITFSDLQSGTASLFEKTGTTENDTTGYTLINDKMATVDMVIQDQIGFMSETGGGKAAVISTTIVPSSSNPSSYNDSSHNLITPEWRVLEPQ